MLVFDGVREKILIVGNSIYNLVMRFVFLIVGREVRCFLVDLIVCFDLIIIVGEGVMLMMFVLLLRLVLELVGEKKDDEDDLGEVILCIVGCIEMLWSKI